MTAPTPAAPNGAAPPPAADARPAETVVFYVSPRDKPALLAALVARLGGRCLVFSATKGGAEAAARALGPAAAVLHGGRTAAARRRALEAFRAGAAAVLVATDLPPDARLPPGPVVLVDVPCDPKAARRHLAGAAGRTAAVLCTAAERRALRGVERAAGPALTVADDQPWHCPAAERGEPERSTRPAPRRSAPARRSGKRIFRDPSITHVGGWI